MRADGASVSEVVLFGIGSPLLFDVEESLHRAGLGVAAGIRNLPGECYLSPGTRLLAPEQLAEDLLGLPFLVPLFAPGHRWAAAQEAARHGLDHPFSLLDPTAILPRRIEIGPGCYVNAGSSFGGGCRLGAYALVNRGATIGHHARLGAFASIGPGAVLAGQITIGTGAVVGAGATILPSVSIGANAVVAAGAVVARDVPPECLAAGNPARILRRDIAGYKGMRVVP